MSLKTFFNDIKLTIQVKKSLYPRIWLRTSDEAELGISLILSPKDLDLLRDDVRWEKETDKRVSEIVKRGGDFSLGEMLAIRMYDFDIDQLAKDIDTSLTFYPDSTRVHITVYAIKNIKSHHTLSSTMLLKPRKRRLVVKIGSFREHNGMTLCQYVFNLLCEDRFKDIAQVRKLFFSSIAVIKSNANKKKVNLELQMQYDRRYLLKPLKWRHRVPASILGIVATTFFLALFFVGAVHINDQHDQLAEKDFLLGGKGGKWLTLQGKVVDT
jgi:hypothetical protein